MKAKKAVMMVSDFFIFFPFVLHFENADGLRLTADSFKMCRFATDFSMAPMSLR